MEDNELEVLVVVMSQQMIDTCLAHQLLPPMIVPETAHHVREFLLYDYETDSLRACAATSGWGWHCAQSLVRTAKVEVVDELMDQETLVKQLSLIHI